MKREDGDYGPIFSGQVKRVANPKLTPDRMTEFEHEKNNTQAPVISLKRKDK